MSLQRSKYICLDDNISKAFVIDSFLKKEMQSKLRDEIENTKKYELIDKICKSKNKEMEMFVK